MWGGGVHKKKINWVAWEVVTKPKDKGGVRVGCFESYNLVLLVKSWWRLIKGYDSFLFSCIKSIHNLKLIDRYPLARG